MTTPENHLIPIDPSVPWSDQEQRTFAQCVQRASLMYCRSHHLAWTNPDDLRIATDIVNSAFQQSWNEFATPQTPRTKKVLNDYIDRGLEERDLLLKRGRQTISYLRQHITHTSNLTHADLLGYSKQSIEDINQQLEHHTRTVHLSAIEQLINEFPQRQVALSQAATVILAYAIDTVPEDPSLTRFHQLTEQPAIQSGFVHGYVASAVLALTREPRSAGVDYSPLFFSNKAIQRLHQVLTEPKWQELLANPEFFSHLTDSLTQKITTDPVAYRHTHPIIVAYLHRVARRATEYKPQYPESDARYWNSLRETFEGLPVDTQSGRVSFGFTPESILNPVITTHLWTNAEHILGYDVPSIADLVTAQRLLRHTLSQHPDPEAVDRLHHVQAAIKAWSRYRSAITILPAKRELTLQRLNLTEAEISTMQAEERWTLTQPSNRYLPNRLRQAETLLNRNREWSRLIDMAQLLESTDTNTLPLAAMANEKIQAQIDYYQRRLDTLTEQCNSQTLYDVIQSVPKLLPRLTSVAEVPSLIQWYFDRITGEAALLIPDLPADLVNSKAMLDTAESLVFDYRERKYYTLPSLLRQFIQAEPAHRPTQLRKILYETLKYEHAILQRMLHAHDAQTIAQMKQQVLIDFLQRPTDETKPHVVDLINEMFHKPAYESRRLNSLPERLLAQYTPQSSEYKQLQKITSVYRLGSKRPPTVYLPHPNQTILKLQAFASKLCRQDPHSPVAESALLLAQIWNDNPLLLTQQTENITLHQYISALNHRMQLIRAYHQLPELRQQATATKAHAYTFTNYHRSKTLQLRLERLRSFQQHLEDEIAHAETYLLTAMQQLELAIPSSPPPNADPA